MRTKAPTAQVVGNGLSGLLQFVEVKGNVRGNWIKRPGLTKTKRKTRTARNSFRGPHKLLPCVSFVRRATSLSVVVCLANVSRCLLATTDGVEHVLALWVRGKWLPRNVVLHGRLGRVTNVVIDVANMLEQGKVKIACGRET